MRGAKIRAAFTFTQRHVGIGHQRTYLHVHNVVGHNLPALYALAAHDIVQPVTLHQQVVCLLARVPGALVDDCAAHGGVALHDDVWEGGLERLQDSLGGC